MSYSYQPKHPKSKLHEIVTKYIASMRALHFEANCSVAFGEGGPASPGAVRGWLLRDPRSADHRQRYLLLEDGDVWREVDAEAGGGERTWLAGPDDEVVTLLAQSLAKARMGVDPFLETEEHVQLQTHVVTDRRHEHHPYQGPERRKSP
jgi:hypothetical protein